MFGGLLYIMQEIKVNNIIIGKQYKSSENYEEFIKIVKEKKINVKIVEGGEKVSIEDNLYFDIIWPFSDNMISDNSINNNSLVCKLNYKNYSMLFTGDIEAIAEKAILKKYSKNLNILKSDILKVAHHGSKTSSITEFIEKIKPKYAIIGVGEDNKFGHPSDSTIQNLEKANIRIYRTDKMGEIEIKTNGKEIKINEFLKRDGFEIYESDNISGRQIFQYRRYSEMKIKLESQSNKHANLHLIGEGSYALVYFYKDDFYDKKTDFLFSKRCSAYRLFFSCSAFLLFLSSRSTVSWLSGFSYSDPAVLSDADCRGSAGMWRI